MGPGRRSQAGLGLLLSNTSTLKVGRQDMGAAERDFLPGTLHALSGDTGS